MTQQAEASPTTSNDQERAARNRDAETIEFWRRAHVRLANVQKNMGVDLPAAMVASAVATLAAAIAKDPKSDTPAVVEAILAELVRAELAAAAPLPRIAAKPVPKTSR